MLHVDIERVVSLHEVLGDEVLVAAHAGHAVGPIMLRTVFLAFCQRSVRVFDAPSFECIRICKGVEKLFKKPSALPSIALFLRLVVAIGISRTKHANARLNLYGHLASVRRPQRTKVQNRNLSTWISGFVARATTARTTD